MRSFLLLSVVVLSLFSRTFALAHDSDAKLGPPASLLAALGAKDVAVTQAAFRPLAQMATVDAEYRPLLRAGMRHIDERTRLLSALGLSASGEASEEVIQEILAAMATVKHSYLTEADFIAEWSLAKQGVRAMPVVVAALKSESTRVQFRALRGVEAIGPAAREALPLVVPLIESKETSIQRHAIMAKWRIDGDDRGAVEKFIPLLSEKRERQCGGTVDCLKKMGVGARRAVPALIAAMKEHKDHAVIEALTELAPHFSWSIAPAMRRSLADPELADPLAAALLHLEGPQDYLLPHLARMMNREGDLPIERHYLATALGEFGPKAAPAIPGLIRTLKSPSGQTRINAAETLGKIGPAAKDALAALRESLADREVAAAAASAIALIEK